MRRSLTPLLLLTLAALASGCGGRAAVRPDYDAVKARSEKSHESLDRAAGVPAPAKAPATGEAIAAPTGSTNPADQAGAAPKSGDVDMRRGKILGKDPDGCTWLEGEASVVVGDQDTRAQARASAVEQARAAAVQDFLGVDVKSKFMDFEQEGLRHDAHLIESILQTTRNGRIIKEQVESEGYRDAAGCPGCRYAVKLKACVLPRDQSADKDFHVEMQISRTRFVQGDEAKITVTATRDCSLYLYDVYDLGAKDKTALVVPNEAVPAETLKAGETWTYPDEDAVRRGVKLVAQLPGPDDEVSAETIRVIATKTPLPAAVYDPTDGGYMGVLRRLHRARVEWAEDAEAYTIYKR
jgi:hypothetical protein